jgi:hypothetical protein
MTQNMYQPADRILWLDLVTRQRNNGTLLQCVTVHAEGYTRQTIRDVEPYPEWDIRGDDGKLYSIRESLIRPLLERETKTTRPAAPTLH